MGDESYKHCLPWSYWKLIGSLHTLHNAELRRIKGLDLLHSTIAKGKKEFLKYLCLMWNKVKLGESLFFRWMLLFGIMLERKEGVSYHLRIIITLYGSSCHDILITMQRNCNFEIVYFSVIQERSLIFIYSVNHALICR